MSDIYIVQETPGKCAACGRDEDLRMGHCFDCAEAESIIAEGTDMWEKDINGVENGDGSKRAMLKLHYLIKKGWRPPEALSNAEDSGEQQDTMPTLPQPDKENTE